MAPFLVWRAISSLTLLHRQEERAPTDEHGFEKKKRKKKELTDMLSGRRENDIIYIRNKTRNTSQLAQK